MRPSACAFRIATAVGGVVVSKPMAKKTTSRPWVLARDLQRIIHGIDHADIGAVGLRLQQAPALGGGHPQHVAIAAEDDAVLFGEFERVVDTADGQDANRAARAMHIADISGIRSCTP